MVLHAFGTSTSRIALRVTFFKFDLEPNVATSLDDQRDHDIGQQIELPDSRNAILTARQNFLKLAKMNSLYVLETYARGCRTWWP